MFIYKKIQKCYEIIEKKNVCCNNICVLDFIETFMTICLPTVQNKGMSYSNLY